VTTNPALIAEWLEPFVAADPVRATLLGTVASMIEAKPDDVAPWAASVPGAVAARSQLRTPVTVLGEWRDVDGLTGALLELRPASINGPQALVDTLASRMAVHQRGRIDERLFRLDELVAPAEVAGRARPATADDWDLLVEWWAAFAAEARDPISPQEVADAVNRALHSGRQWLWLDADDAPVSMAAGRAPVRGSARIGPVYTPPALRGHGFASAVTARATQEVLDSGAVPVLFTDRSNPTSNKIYQQLGYRPVDDHAFVSFDWANGNNVDVTATGRVSGSPGSSRG